MIHHLSYPAGESVNDFIDDSSCSVKYSSVDDAVDLVQTLGRGALLGKMDIKSAFRLLPVYPGDFDQLGFQVDNLIYFDKCLPMGASVSCALFEKFSTFLEWATKQDIGQPSASLLHYLDDFLFGGEKDTSQCIEYMMAFQKICKLLGVPLADNKTVGPCNVLTFLGVEFDTNDMIIRLPLDKLLDLKEKILGILSLKKITLEKLQSLIGSLHFACRVVRPGRAFCRRLIDATRGIKQPKHKIRVTCNMRADLHSWLDFLDGYNGVTVMPDRLWTTNETLELFTDSAGGKDKGFGIYFNKSWAFGPWPHEWSNTPILRNITFLELLPVCAALAIWGDELANKKVLFHIDNKAVVTIINKQSAKDPLVMVLVRKLVVSCLKANILLKAEHIPGCVNKIADSISRLQWDKFRLLAPEADPCPVQIPPHVWQI
ncbi:uncharacterized protein LOC117343303 [Pecten maximus]|uniref:uncharacterized protein LOC117343303 n=1 Tax=Pecten maximus TaxID=6579 RepID=UPI001458041B|nr:uncharacterized protein LOC117343303 [Pecten maximus]